MKNRDLDMLQNHGVFELPKTEIIDLDKERVRHVRDIAYVLNHTKGLEPDTVKALNELMRDLARSRETAQPKWVMKFD